jgi:hypothetical protein
MFVVPMCSPSCRTKKRSLLAAQRIWGGAFNEVQLPAAANNRTRTDAFDRPRDEIHDTRQIAVRVNMAIPYSVHTDVLTNSSGGTTRTLDDVPFGEVREYSTARRSAVRCSCDISRRFGRLYLS